MNLGWMAWTWASAGFFALIAISLIVLTLLAIYRPETPRAGLFRFRTTRGDRYFISLIGSAYIFIVWMRLGGGELFYPFGISILFGVAMFRYA